MEATCTEEGHTAYYVCDECGLWFEDATGLIEITDKTSVIIKALGHKWDKGTVTKAATATREGIRTYTCLHDSSHTKEEVIPARGRSHREGGSSSSGTAKAAVSGAWSQEGETWHYTENGSMLKGVWRYLGYNGESYWYYFDEKGDMATGWLEWNGSRYYLYPVSDGWKGRMLTGWQEIGGKWYYFETEAGKDQGHLYTGTETPDGHRVGADGARTE